MRAFLLTLFLATPVLADPIQGAADPAFHEPFQRALRGDDPTALLDLHAAAEAGNTSALLALPAVSNWLRATLPFAERKKLGRVNGTPIAKAFAAADPTAALWALGEPGSDMNILLARAFALYDAGEPDKATVLFSTWLNQTGGYEELPADFFDHPVPPWLMAYVLRGRLIDSGYSTPADGDALLVARLRADDPAAWITLAGFADQPPDGGTKAHHDRLFMIVTAAGFTWDDAERRMAAALPALKAIRRADPVLDPQTAAAATALFRDEPEFQPLLALCATACPRSEDRCATAFVAAFGHPFGRTTSSQPLTSLIASRDFYASPRGRLLLLKSTFGQLGDDPTASPALLAARQIDACLADAVLAANP